LGAVYLQKVLGDVRASVDKEGELTEKALEGATIAFGGHPNIVTAKLKGFRDMLKENLDGLAEDALKAKHRRLVLEHIEKELARCEHELPALMEREEYEEQARQAASFLPSAETVDKILRYMTTLDRQFYRALNQLERLQRLRRGDLVPPPLAMEVSHMT
jgi:hypothetical protein